MAYNSRTLRKIATSEILSSFLGLNRPRKNFTVPAASERISPEDQNLLLAIRSQIETEESNNFLANIDVMTEVVKHVNVTGEILNYLIEEVHNRIDPEDPQRGHKIARFYEEIFSIETDSFALKIRDLTSENLTNMTKYAYGSYPLLSKIIAHQNSNIETFIAPLENILVSRTILLCQNLLHALWYKFSDDEEKLNLFALAIDDWNEMFLMFMNKLDPSNEMHMRVLGVLRNNEGINDSASTVDAYIIEHNYARNLAAAVAGDAPLASDTSLAAADESSEVGDAPLASDTSLAADDDSSEVGDAPLASDTSLAADDDDASIASEASEERIINNRVDELLDDIEIPLRLNAFEEHCRKAARNIVSLDLNIDVDFTVESEQEAEYIAEVERNHPGVLDAIVDRISLSDPFSAQNLAKSNPETINKFRLRVNE